MCPPCYRSDTVRNISVFCCGIKYLAAEVAIESLVMLVLLLPHHSNHLTNNGPIYLHPIWSFGHHMYLNDHLFFELCHGTVKVSCSVSVYRSHILIRACSFTALHFQVNMNMLVTEKYTYCWNRECFLLYAYSTLSKWL
jgi:hypothetical protein